MKYYIIIFLLISFTSPLLSQNVKYQNNIFVEVFGNGGVYSLNYDRIVYDNLSARIGATLIKSNDNLIKGFPVIANYRIYFNNNYTELGLGVTIFSAPLDIGKFTNEKFDGALLTAVISYCFQSKAGINGRIVFTPFYYQNKFIPFGGFSIGYSF